MQTGLIIWESEEDDALQEGSGPLLVADGALCTRTDTGITVVS
ncbi:hypothetical protein [Saccharopolyspora spinosa]|uniref:Uncharacterized protein n=1 Tax=Saccharopolyspora spinosa TaxID=60894 RepID=A0A2N3Y482_SACSN|nr:hypothetical protein [Saccharopolyspora spinosa]PKW17735.1 hypothetical protein A8926_5738 [Saccharopolyspora spinosa]